MRYDGMTIGVITLAKLDLDGFSLDDVRILTILADRAATAVGSARLLTRTQALAREMRRPIQPKHADYEKLTASLDRGDIDFAMNGLEITPENVRRARFTRPYYIYQLQLIARIDDDRFTTLKECKDRRLKVGTLNGSAAMEVLKGRDPVPMPKSAVA